MNVLIPISDYTIVNAIITCLLYIAVGFGWLFYFVRVHEHDIMAALNWPPESTQRSLAFGILTFWPLIGSLYLIFVVIRFVFEAAFGTFLAIMGIYKAIFDD